MVALTNNDHDIKSTTACRPQLLMLWGQEWDGDRLRLVARWVVVG